ncbi:alpha/beta hydrolase [Amycolatopsis jejuensis]|uniref:alpha/beta hydrolase n=1 Tax=Amycolatopsis jejuensis TaxID=330084 RepID=UPI001FDF7438|nr:alpha/beta hydrolase [Amycolatopsis jejuensis]
MLAILSAALLAFAGTATAAEQDKPIPADLSDVTSASGAHCQNYFFPVTETPGSSAVLKEFGQLCTADPALLGKQPVQILIHGGTYDHTYYDWPYQPERYNYVRYMTQRGFTTLNLDRIGYGHSDHPLGASMNFDVAADTTHQIVQYLRQGALGKSFDTITVNGYSMGGLTAQVEAGKYHDVDALMVHAVGHGLLTPRSTLRLGTFAYPAALDPKFAGKLLDPAYLTSIPGKRDLFHGPQSTFDPQQLNVEEATKDTMSATELADITLRTYTDQTKNIDVPILWSPGQYDKIWCGTTDDCNTDPMSADEANYYRPGVFTKHIVQNTGHATLLGYGGVDYLNEIVGWLAARGIHGVR